jgi:hypothetical protein
MSTAGNEPRGPQSSPGAQNHRPSPTEVGDSHERRKNSLQRDGSFGRWLFGQSHSEPPMKRFNNGQKLPLDKIRPMQDYLVPFFRKHLDHFFAVSSRTAPSSRAAVGCPE